MAGAPTQLSPDKNYITPLGMQRLQQEYDQLKRKERPQVVDVVAWAAGNGDRSENADYQYGKRRLREIDKRLAFLQRQMEAAEVIDPATFTAKEVLFGATVTIEEEDGKQKTYAIVGTDETEPEKGKISWKSPLARALYRAKVGDFITFESPQGERDVEVLKIEYKVIA